MGLFDGLIAKVEGAVTSAEQRAAGLVTEAESAVGVPPSWLSIFKPGPAATPSAPATMTTTPFYGPMLPGQPRPAPRPMAVYNPAPGPQPFNMVADMLSSAKADVSKGVSGVESLLADIPGMGSVVQYPQEPRRLDESKRRGLRPLLGRPRLGVRPLQ